MVRRYRLQLKYVGCPYVGPGEARPGSDHELAQRPPGSYATALDLRGRTALVTGAAGGIGRACALRLAAAGARVGAVDRDAAGLAELVDAAGRTPGAAGGAVEPYVLDLTDLDAAERAAAGTDVLVNNAGIQLVRPIEEFPPDVFHTVLTVMPEAPFRLIRGALPHMYEQGWGRIVNMSSVHGLRASAHPARREAARRPYAEARRCLDALNLLGRGGDGAAADDFGFLGLLLAGERDVAGFVTRTIGPVVAYDERRGTELLDTLDAYFASGMSPVRTKDELHVHVNTVAQRLERVARLLGDDWQSPARVLEVQLALRLHRLGALPGRG